MNNFNRTHESRLKEEKPTPRPSPIGEGKCVFVFLCLLLFSGCQNDPINNKLIDTLPVNVEATVLPAQAVQFAMIYKLHSLQTIVPIANRTFLTSSVWPDSYPEITSVGEKTYQFQVSDPKAGNVTYNFQFKNASNVAIDPIADISSTGTIKSIDVTLAVGASSLFTFTESTVMTYATEGDPNSTIRTTGDMVFNGSGYTNLTLTFQGAGAETTTDGYRSGQLRGTGPDLSTTQVEMTLNLRSLHILDGDLSWEGQTGQIHIEEGTGFVISNNSRIPIN